MHSYLPGRNLSLACLKDSFKMIGSRLIEMYICFRIFQIKTRNSNRTLWIICVSNWIYILKNRRAHGPPPPSTNLHPHPIPPPPPKKKEKHTNPSIRTFKQNRLTDLMIQSTVKIVPLPKHIFYCVCDFILNYNMHFNY